jgi:hypothetical protein
MQAERQIEAVAAMKKMKKAWPKCPTVKAPPKASLSLRQTRVCALGRHQELTSIASRPSESPPACE